MNSTHKITKFVKSSREKGAVNLVNKKGMYSMHSFPICTNTLQLLNNSCATYCSEKLQAEKHCILMHPLLTVVHSRLTRDNVGARAQENPNKEKASSTARSFILSSKTTFSLSLLFYTTPKHCPCFCCSVALPLASVRLNSARVQIAKGVKQIFIWEKVYK